VLTLCLARIEGVRERFSCDGPDERDSAERGFPGERQCVLGGLVRRDGGNEVAHASIMAGTADTAR